MTKEVGRVPDGTGLSSPTEPQERLGPSGFDPSRILRPDMAARLCDFASAVSGIPWVAAGVAAGQQFNVYDTADNEEEDDPADWVYSLCLGPITNHRFICLVPGRDRALLVEAAMKVATEALRERGGRDSDGSPQGRDREDGLDGEAATARAEGIAQPQSASLRAHADGEDTP